MKILVPLDGSPAAFAAIAHVKSLAAARVPLQVLLLHVQLRFHRHISQFTRKSARDALRAERSAAALAPAVEALSGEKIPFVALTECGAPAERIAAVAERERVDEIVMGTGRHPRWLRGVNPSIAQEVMQRTDVPVTVLARGRVSRLQRYGVPAGIAGLAALLLVAD
ncbi:MAG TPA: universal stress protein [Burkholderiales bacterium]|nr:universal stress protein [Burkholderiales bacterium]